MLINPFKSLRKREWLIWGISLFLVIISNIFSGKVSFVTFMGPVIGVTALIFVAVGNVWGQILSVVFAVFYAISSWKLKYYGEVFTYLGMTAPIALMSVFSWLKNPYEKGKSEVRIHRMKKSEIIVMFVLTALVTFMFYFVLKFFNTASLITSTVSIATSFLASYLMFYRNSYYAVAYALNDVVLMVLWIIASIKDSVYIPVLMCFIVFFINDIYGFISWKIREKKQRLI